MENFKMDDFTMPSELKVGDVVKGVVVQVEANTIYLDLQSFTEGKMYLEHYTKDKTISSFKGLVKVGDVIVFKRDGILIIHRIVKISNDGDKIIISTKGDNNKDIDGFEVTDKNFVGKVLFKIKFIGWPAVLISEILE